jgi:hypothetical protein
LTQVSSLLTLIDIWRNETNCKQPFHSLSFVNLSALDLVWVSVLNSFGGIIRPFEERPQIDTSLRAFIRVRFIQPVIRNVLTLSPEVDIVCTVGSASRVRVSRGRIC